MKINVHHFFLCESWSLPWMQTTSGRQTAVFPHVGAIRSALYHLLTMQSKHLAVQLQFVSLSYGSARTQPAYQWVMCERRWEFPAHRSRVKCAAKKKKKSIIHGKFDAMRLLLPTVSAFFLVTPIWDAARTQDFKQTSQKAKKKKALVRWVTKLNVWWLAVSWWSSLGFLSSHELIRLSNESSTLHNHGR